MAARHLFAFAGVCFPLETMRQPTQRRGGLLTFTEMTAWVAQKPVPICLRRSAVLSAGFRPAAHAGRLGGCWESGLEPRAATRPSSSQTRSRAKRGLPLCHVAGISPQGPTERALLSALKP